MALKNYGILKGRPIARRLGFGKSPHYQIHIVDDEEDYRIAINVKSKKHPSELLYLIDEQFVHPITDDLQELQHGFTEVNRQPGGMAMDYIRANLFDPEKMVALPYDVPGPDNDLNEKIDYYVQRSLGDENAVIYAFGERWGPEKNRRDKYFGFKPGNGVHDIHMNQGSVEPFKKYNGVWQDGGMLIHFPDENRWVAVFLAFQSQCWHTDDEEGNCIGEDQLSTEAKSIVIIAAMVNPIGHDPGFEKVILINTTADNIKLAGWSLVDKNKRNHPLPDKSVEPGEVVSVHLPGDTIQLSNKGGIITLLDENGIKIHGVQYTKKSVACQGCTIVF